MFPPDRSPWWPMLDALFDRQMVLMIVGTLIVAPLVWIAYRRQPGWPALVAMWPEANRPPGYQHERPQVFERTWVRAYVAAAGPRPALGVQCRVVVHDTGISVRPRYFAAAAPGAFVPWSAVGECEPGLRVRGKYSTVTTVIFRFRDGLGEINVEDPAGTIALGRFRTWLGRRAGPDSAERSPISRV